jgi:tetratricopeptide (TPR) repeat protein
MSPQVAVSDGGYREQMGVGPFLLQQSDNKDDAGIYFEFTGVNAGFLAYAMASVKAGRGVVVMLNTGDDVNGLGKEIRRAVAKTYGWKNFLPEEIQPLQLSSAELEQFVGRYRKGADEVVYIERQDNYLVETINEGNAIYCFPVAKDTVVFTDFNVKGGFARDAAGTVVSLQTVWQEAAMPKMKPDEFTPSELLKLKRYEEAKAGFRDLMLNEYQLTYQVYERLNSKNADMQAVKSLLELAAEQYPASAIVWSRWGDYYRKTGEKEKAIVNYQKALSLDPVDQQVAELIKSLQQ